MKSQNTSAIIKKAVSVPDTLKNRFVKWVNKKITHPRDDDGDYGIRVLLHIPIGLLMGIPIIGYQLMRMFLLYEKNEDKWTSDEACTTPRVTPAPSPAAKRLRTSVSRQLLNCRREE